MSDDKPIHWSVVSEQRGLIDEGYANPGFGGFGGVIFTVHVDPDGTAWWDEGGLSSPVQLSEGDWYFRVAL